MGKCYTMEEISAHICDNICKYPEAAADQEELYEKYCDKCILTNVRLYFKENDDDNQRDDNN